VSDSGGADVQRVSVVVPVYQGERTLEPLVEEIVPITCLQQTPGGRPFQVTDMFLVNEGAIDGSSSVMTSIEVHQHLLSLFQQGRLSPPALSSGPYCCWSRIALIARMTGLSSAGGGACVVVVARPRYFFTQLYCSHPLSW
jgi:hypothetical protein